MIKYDADICSRFETSSSLEWLETNGVGGYASSTVSGANTRRYHGLLVSATRPPLGRLVLLSKFEEALIIDGERHELSSNQFPGKVHPEGFRFMTRFSLDPFPRWIYEVNGLEIEETIFMVHGENSTVCRWRVTNKIPDGSSVELELRPLLAFRDHHNLRREDALIATDYQVEGTRVSITPFPGMPTLCLAHNANGVEHQGHWYRDFQYAMEQERGFDFTEDLFQPFSLRFDLSDDAVVIASTQPKQVADAKTLENAEISRRTELVETAAPADEFSTGLVLAADAFLVSRGTGKTVIAGYHWFSDWGRDTMIALPGLTLATNRPDIARSILLEFSRHISDGMLPNRFPDAGDTPEYNTVDATLWFFEAIRAYTEKTGDYQFVRDDLYEKLIDIIDWHERGTRYNIHVDSDGLLYAGEQRTQLTWMDAKVGDWVVTPRTGKAVEIQALWYNALCVMADLAHRFDDAKRETVYRAMAVAAKSSFSKQFWNAADRCLFDVVNGLERDASIRPNQIFAVSLTHTMITSEEARQLVDRVETDLLTPYGLRSLSPADERYVGVYAGSPLKRDGSYHQGTVWAWLIGPFIDAYRRVHSKHAMAEKRVSEMLSGLKTHLTEAMAGQISEIFDGDWPHTPRGCAAQAWSVAELLKISSIKL